jgi:ADP-ribose pyrophosphatase
MGAKKLFYKGKKFSVEQETLSKAGKRFKVERVVHPEFVLIIPVLSGSKIVMERQFRGAINKYIYELPAGTVEKGEDLKKTVKRELEEETGYKAKKLKYLFKAYTTPGFTTELAYVYEASELSMKKVKLDKDEIIAAEVMGLDKALRMIRSNQITDMKTIAALLFYINSRQAYLEDYRYR